MSKIRKTADLALGKNPLPANADNCGPTQLAVPLLHVSSYKDTNPVREASALMTEPLPTGPTH